MSPRHGRQIRIAGRRVALAVPTIFGMSILIFAIGRIALARPEITALGQFASPAAKREFRQTHHLDDPLISQYVLWLRDLVHGDLGRSLITQSPVVDILKSGAIVTGQLTLGAIILAAVLGLGLGTLAGIRPRSVLNRLVSSGSLLAVSVPQFWLGLVLAIVLGVELHVLPAGGYISLSTDPLQSMQSMALPCITLAAGPAGLIARVTQVRVAEESFRPHVLTARSLGVSQTRIVSRYILRNALLEPTTVIGIQVGYMLGGAILVEQVFNLPGLGQIALTATHQGDFPVVQAVAIVTTVVFLMVNLGIDLLHTVLDTRAGLAE